MKDGEGNITDIRCPPLLEMADLLGLKSGTAYDLVKRGYFETTLIDRRIRIITSSFEAWYQKQTHYVKISERSNENGIYREA